MIEGHDAEVNAIVTELVQAGLVTIGTDAEGRETWTLTEQGERMARMLAMYGDEVGEVLGTLLDASEPDTGDR